MEFTTEELEGFRAASEKAARLGGECLMRWLGKVSIEEKNPRDLVTQADFESQQTIEKYLSEQFPDHTFVGEESEDKSSFPPPDDQCCWIVDPLDGTTNYVHQMRSFSVSVALRYGGRTIAGTVYDPALDECFSAALDAGATLNGQPIKNSGCTELDKAMLICSFRSSVTREHPEVERFLRLIGVAGSIRRLGSAALNLCYVACGRADGYWAGSLNCWDIAAGWLILEETGGRMQDFAGNPVNIVKPQFCATSTGELFDQLKPKMHIE